MHITVRTTKLKYVTSNMNYFTLLILFNIQ